MSTITAPARELTPDDVLDMPDDALYELVDGRLVELNMSAEVEPGRRATSRYLLKNHCDGL